MTIHSDGCKMCGGYPDAPRSNGGGESCPCRCHPGAPERWAELHAAKQPVDVHTWFGLSYASYLTVNRSLLQSMPMEWQHRFTALMNELWAEFPDIKEPTYTVYARGDGGRFVRDPVPNYNRGRTFVKGRANSLESAT